MSPGADTVRRTLVFLYNALILYQDILSVDDVYPGDDSAPRRTETRSIRTRCRLGTRQAAYLRRSRGFTLYQRCAERSLAMDTSPSIRQVFPFKYRGSSGLLALKLMNAIRCSPSKCQRRHIPWIIYSSRWVPVSPHDTRILIIPGGALGSVIVPNVW